MAVKSDKRISAALSFLKTGRRPAMEAEKLTAACDELVRMETERSSASAIRLGRSFVALSRKNKDISLADACRALGWALLVSGKYPEAAEIYLEARELVRKDPAARGRIDRVLTDVYMYLGDFIRARRHAQMSLKTFEKLGMASDLAKTRVNYANLLHRQDCHREAEKLYRDAARFFESQGVDIAVAFCEYNRANTLVQLFDFEQAGDLYRNAEKIFETHGHDLRANGCRYGLAWLHILEGDYHVALEELTRCQKEYEAASQPREVVLCQLDRAEAFLGINLFSDAVDAAREAEKGARKLSIDYESAKAALFAAKALIALGRFKKAGQALERARSGFGNERNRPFLATTEFLTAQIEPDRQVRIKRMVKARRGFQVSQLPLWEAVCDLQYLTERPREKKALERLSRNPAVKAVPHLYARRQTMLGDRAASAGRMASARKHWKQAADRLDTVRAKLPPVDMISAFTSRNSDPYLKLVNANLDKDPLTAAAWSERYHTAGLWSVPDEMLADSPERIRAERSLADLANRVTTLCGRLSGPEGHRGALAAHEVLNRLQKQVRTDLAALNGTGSRSVSRIDSLCSTFRAVSEQQPVIQFHVDGDDLVAFIHSGGESRYHRYADGVRSARDYAGRWRFLMERTVATGGRTRRSDLDDEKDLLGLMGDWLWAPLELRREPKRLVVLPDGHVANFPWQAVVYDGDPLGVRHDLVFAPSIRHHLHARSRNTKSGKIKVFVGTTEGLSRFRRDYSVLLKREREQVEVCHPCKRSDWPNSERARLWHYVGHAQLRSDNPFYSSLLLDDGPLFAADLRLRKNTVGLVTLAACRTGQQAYHPGEESAGLVRSFLEMGARNVIASQWAVHDNSTALWMNTFYNHYLSGRSVCSSTREALLAVRNKYPAAYHWAAFSAYGAG